MSSLNIKRNLKLTKGDLEGSFSQGSDLAFLEEGAQTEALEADTWKFLNSVNVYSDQELIKYLGKLRDVADQDGNRSFFDAFVIYCKRNRVSAKVHDAMVDLFLENQARYPKALRIYLVGVSLKRALAGDPQGWVWLMELLPQKDEEQYFTPVLDRLALVTYEELVQRAEIQTTHTEDNRIPLHRLENEPDREKRRMTTITHAASLLQADQRFTLPIAWAIDLELELRPPSPQKLASAQAVESLAAILGSVSASTDPENLEATKLLAKAILKLKPGVPTTEAKDLTPIWGRAAALLERKAPASR